MIRYRLTYLFRMYTASQKTAYFIFGLPVAKCMDFTNFWYTTS